LVLLAGKGISIILVVRFYRSDLKKKITRGRQQIFECGSGNGECGNKTHSTFRIQITLPSIIYSNLNIPEYPC
jgi:hypothetical protein